MLTVCILTIQKEKSFKEKKISASNSMKTLLSKYY